jgi:hypothetical protein
MCDCYSAKCEECDRELPVHIGDFSTPRENVLVRCKKHKPTANDGLKWVKFTDVEDYIDSIPYPYEPLVSFRFLRKKTDWYMAIKDYAQVESGYDVGEEGGITPNCDWKTEEVVLAKTNDTTVKFVKPKESGND